MRRSFLSIPNKQPLSTSLKESPFNVSPYCVSPYSVSPYRALTPVTLLTVAFAVCFCLLSGEASAQSANGQEVSLGSNVSIVSNAGTSSLNRQTRQMTTPVNVQVTNTSTKRFLIPIHCAIRLSDSRVTVVGSSGTLIQGGLNQAPYGAHFVTLGTSGYYSPNDKFTFSFSFVRPSAVSFTHSFECFGVEAPSNLPPVANAGPDREILLYPGENDTAIRLDARGSSDPDGRITLYSWGGTPQPSPEATPSLRIGPGHHVFSLSVTDDKGAGSLTTDQVTIDVRQAPEPHPPILELSTTESVINEGQSLTVTAEANDPDGELVTISLSPLLAGANFDSQPGVSAQGSFVFNPTLDDAGSYTFTFEARDETGLRSSQVLSVTVHAVNRAPILSVTPNFSVTEGSALSFQVQASDPDSDPLLLAVANLPANAVFLAGEGRVIFNPDYDQSGAYALEFSASDNQLVSQASTVIDVVDVTPGSSPGGLTLEVDPVESPTLSTTARITGRVNQQASTAPINKPVSALIDTLLPATLQQGQKTDVVVRGPLTGPFVPHFVDGVSSADFGEGISARIKQFVNPQELIVEVEVNPSASVGPRSPVVRTTSEVASSLLAFNIVPGKTEVRGILKDPGTGNPIIGAFVTVLGTPQGTRTLNDGSFVLQGLPLGQISILINAPNYEPLIFPIDAQANTTIELGELQAESLVFNANAAPSATLPSVLNRGLASTDGRIGVDAAKQVVVDSFIALGGTEAGVMDAYGNQLNPKVQGEGLVSLSPEMVDYTAELMARGDGASLQDILFGLAWVFTWQKGAPPTLAQMLNSLQKRVDEAWADQKDPNNQILIAIFNDRRTIAPTPPTLTPSTRLGALQRQLLVTSFVAFVQQIADANPQINGKNEATPPASVIANLAQSWMEKLSLVEDAFADNIQINLPPHQDTFTNFWANTFLLWGNMPGGTVASMAQPLVTVGVSKIIPALAPSAPTNLGNSSAAGILFGTIRTLIVNILVEAIIEVLTPRPPLPLKATPLQIKGVENAPSVVLVTFTRTYGDKGKNNPPGLRFAYRLWRWDTLGGKLLLVGGGEPDRPGNNQDDLRTTVWVNPDNSHELAIADYNPKPGHNTYKLDVIRSVGKIDQGNDGFSNIGNGLDWWINFLPTPSLSLGGFTSFNPAGTLLAFLDPLAQIANALRLMISPMSNNISAYIATNLPAGDPADGFVVDPRWPVAYESVRSESMIYSIDLNTLKKTEFVNPGFKTPYQSGLAVDYAGSLYTDNAASDDNFGGKIFRFRGLFAGGAQDPARTHVGMTNYYSFLLGYARPTMVPAMINSLDGQLFVADAVENRIKKVPVNHTYDPYRRVGQLWAESPLFSFGPGMDLAKAWDESLYVVTPSNAKVVEISSKDRTITDFLGTAGSILEKPRSLALDRFRNAYIADEGLAPSAKTGRIIFITPFYQKMLREYEECEIDKFTIMRGLTNLSFVRIDQWDQSLIYREGGVVKRAFLGISGQVLDKFGLPITGAEVSLAKNGLVPTPQITGNCGVFHFLGLTSDNSSVQVQLTVKVAGEGTQVFRTTTAGTGHKFTNLYFNDPTPPPVPQNSEPTTVEDGPLPQVTAPPVTVPRSPAGKKVILPDMPITLPPLPDLQPASNQSPPPPPPPAQPGERATLVFPIAETEVAPMSLQKDLSEVEILIGSSVQSDLENLSARAFVNGNEVAFGSDFETSNDGLLSHEKAHVIQLKASDLKAASGQASISVSLEDADGKVVRAMAATVRGTVATNPDTGQDEFAQPSTRSLLGRTIAADDGRPLTGVNVRLDGTDLKATSDEFGVYRFPAAPVSANASVVLDQ